MVDLTSFDKESPRQNITLTIIGNGFDLCHGLKTRYTDFVEEHPSKSLQRMKEFNTDNKIKFNDWYNVEEQIRYASKKAYELGVNRQHPGIALEFQSINESIVEDFSSSFKNYLINLNNKKIKPISSVKRALNCTDAILSFNYTDTPSVIYNFPKANVYYMHGSLNEQQIIFGIDNSKMLDLSTSSKFRSLDKGFERDVLSFKRYLSGKSHTTICNKKIIDQFKDFDSYYYSWRKIQPVLLDESIYINLISIDEMLAPTSHYFVSDYYKDCLARSRYSINKVSSYLKGQKINKRIIPYVARFGFHPFKICLPNNVRIDTIRNINIMGHSLHSDQEIISDLITYAPQLRNVIIFTYRDESREEIVWMKNWIRSIRSTVHIETVPYC